MTMLNAALLYAENGLPVFPCGADKKPLVKTGFKAATKDPEQIRAWWKRWPTAMIGMPTGPASGIDVLDLDLKNGKNGLATLPDWERYSNIIVRTPSGGAQEYFRSQGVIRNTTDKIGSGVDTRGDGGYGIVPPSRNASGAYRFERCGLEALGKLPPFPADLLARLQVDDEGPRKAGAEPEADPALIARALAVIPNADVGWEDWNRVAMAAFRATDGAVEGFAAFDAWSKKSKKYKAATTRAKWRQLFRSPPTQIGSGSLFYMANEVAPGWQEAIFHPRNETPPAWLAKDAPVRPLPKNSVTDPATPEPKSNFKDWVAAKRERGEGINVRGHAPTVEISFEKIENAPLVTEDDLLDPNSGHVVKDLNEIYALVVVGGKAVVMDTSKEPPEFWQLETFHTYYANRKKVVLQDGKKMAVTKFWLQSRNRRTYDGLVFSPQREVPGYYNLWRGFAVKPRPGDCSKFLTHIRDNVCGGNDDLYKWVVGWLADIVQNPANKIGTSLVLRGKQGTGKTIVGKIFGSLLGLHYVPVSAPRMVTGQFNSHLTSCLLLHVDEGFWAGDRAAEGKLKDLITGDFQFIEFKGKEAFRVRNYLRMLVSGNPNWMIPAGHEERRFAVLDVGEGKMQDHSYFAAIEAEADNGGREALLDHLLKFDLESMDLRKIPLTDALLDQKISTLGSEEAWWLDVLAKGELPGGCDGTGQCPAQTLFNDYIRHARKQGVPRRSIETQIGKFLTDNATGLVKLPHRSHKVQTRLTIETRVGSIYQFPSLTDCRAAFEKKLNNQKPDWGDDQVDWVTGSLGVLDGEFE